MFDLGCRQRSDLTITLGGPRLCNRRELVVHMESQLIRALHLLCFFYIQNPIIGNFLCSRKPQLITLRDYEW